ncbi:DoxX family protein [Nonomuraea sp. NBC_01738]|uniref:DoxX family protein n=1 Tax=Nonomuraea sp. NBC_01738 TaxID=2976003 RepID=UPI002E157AC1|nr:DoxX family protein [Nonomuraea sp. NBC_01738]
MRDLAALVARVGVGGLFFANGWAKLEQGLINTGAEFARQGAPAPGAWATTTMLFELIGGALLIAGLAVSVTGLVLFLEALAVFLIAPPLNQLDTNALVALGAASVLLAVVGAGRISVDHMVVIRRRESEAASEFAADDEADKVIASLRAPDPELPAASGEPASDDPKSGDPASEDTAPHRRPSRRTGEQATSEPGDTLVAGRKKPAARTRKPPATDD